MTLFFISCFFCSAYKLGSCNKNTIIVDFIGRFPFNFNKADDLLDDVTIHVARNVKCYRIIAFKQEISFKETVYNKQIINVVA